MSTPRLIPRVRRGSSRENGSARLPLKRLIMRSVTCILFALMRAGFGKQPAVLCLPSQGQMAPGLSMTFPNQIMEGTFSYSGRVNQTSLFQWCRMNLKTSFWSRVHMMKMDPGLSLPFQWGICHIQTHLYHKMFGIQGKVLKIF